MQARLNLSRVSNILARCLPSSFIVVWRLQIFFEYRNLELKSKVRAELKYVGSSYRDSSTQNSSGMVNNYAQIAVGLSSDLETGPGCNYPWCRASISDVIDDVT